jgi:hypothetical protein
VLKLLRLHRGCTLTPRFISAMWQPESLEDSQRAYEDRAINVGTGSFTTGRTRALCMHNGAQAHSVVPDVLKREGRGASVPVTFESSGFLPVRTVQALVWTTKRHFSLALRFPGAPPHMARHFVTEAAVLDDACSGER